MPEEASPPRSRSRSFFRALSPFRHRHRRARSQSSAAVDTSTSRRSSISDRPLALRENGILGHDDNPEADLAFATAFAEHKPQGDMYSHESHSVHRDPGHAYTHTVLHYPEYDPEIDVHPALRAFSPTPDHMTGEGLPTATPNPESDSGPNISGDHSNTIPLIRVNSRTSTIHLSKPRSRPAPTRRSFLTCSGRTAPISTIRTGPCTLLREVSETHPFMPGIKWS
jgi:hypothetical protein